MRDLDVKHLKEKGIYTPLEDMKKTTADTVKYIFLDAILSLIAGMRSLPEEEKAALEELLGREMPQVRPVWPGKVKTSLEMAGFVNGYCLRYADWGDAQRPPVSRGGHPSDMCAAMLALCDMPGVSGKSVIEALNVAYRLWVQVQNKMMYKRPEFDPTTYLSLTLPVMISVLLGETPEQTQNALNLSAASGTTLLQVRPHDITNLKCGATGYSIARAFWLHRMGSFLKAPGSMFDGANGWYKVVAGLDGELEAMDDDAVYGQIQVKALPCCNVNQAACECGQALYGRISGQYGRIKRIAVHVSPQDAGIALKAGKPQYPYDHPSADHHIKYCLAVTLKYGELTPLHYDESCYADADIRRLIDAAEGSVLTDGELEALGGGKGPCTVELELTDGSTLVQSVSRPAGYFVGLNAQERCAGLARAADIKQAIIERCYGYELSGLRDTVMSLENYESAELLDVLASIMGNG